MESISLHLAFHSCYYSHWASFNRPRSLAIESFFSGHFICNLIGAKVERKSSCDRGTLLASPDVLPAKAIPGDASSERAHLMQADSLVCRPEGHCSKRLAGRREQTASFGDLSYQRFPFCPWHIVLYKNHPFTLVSHASVPSTQGTDANKLQRLQFRPAE